MIVVCVGLGKEKAETCFSKPGLGDIGISKKSLIKFLLY